MKIYWVLWSKQLKNKWKNDGFSRKLFKIFFLHKKAWKNRKTTTFHCCRSKRKSYLSWKLHTDQIYKFVWAEWTNIWICSVCVSFFVLEYTWSSDRCLKAHNRRSAFLENFRAIKQSSSQHTKKNCFWSLVLRRVKVKCQCRFFFLFKIEHGLFRVIGLKLAGEQPRVFVFLIFSLLPFILPPYL